MKALLSLFIGLFIMSSLGAVGLQVDRSKQQQTIESLCIENDTLITALRTLRIKEYLRNDFIAEFTDRIDAIRAGGHRPDSSLVFQTMKEFLKWPNMTWDDLDTLFRKESGYGRDKRRGMFGEITFAQRDTGSLREDLSDIGFEVTHIDYKDYHNVVSSAEMAVLYMMRVKLLRDGKADHVVYFNGFYTKLKKYNTSRFDAEISRRKAEKPQGGR